MKDDWTDEQELPSDSVRLYPKGHCSLKTAALRWIIEKYKCKTRRGYHWQLFAPNCPFVSFSICIPRCLPYARLITIPLHQTSSSSSFFSISSSCFSSSSSSFTFSSSFSFSFSSIYSTTDSTTDSTTALYHYSLLCSASLSFAFSCVITSYTNNPIWTAKGQNTAKDYVLELNKWYSRFCLTRPIRSTMHPHYLTYTLLILQWFWLCIYIWLMWTDGRTDGLTDKWMNGISPHSTGLRPLSEPLPKKRTTENSKQGERNSIDCYHRQ